MRGVMRRMLGRETGAALVLALVAVLLLSLLLSGIALMTTGDLDIGRVTRWDALALYLAEAGMEDQIYRFKADKDAGPIAATVYPADGTVTGLSLRYTTRIKCLENCGGNPSYRVWEVSSWGMIYRQSDSTPLQRRTVVAEVRINYTGTGADLNRFPSGVSFVQWEERYPSPAIPPPDTGPPAVTITSPANNARVSGVVTIDATASDDVGVSRVDFYVDGVLHSSDLTAPYSASWDTTSLAEGSTHTLTATAFDAVGNQGTSTVTVKVRNVPWWNAAWGFRKKITIDYTKVAATLTNFPVLISRTDTDLQSKAQADGDDIAFTASDGTTKLSHKIEKFDVATGQLVAWVKVPSLSSSANTILYMYYGNPAATDQQDAVNVWDTNYQAVWHLKEDPSGTAPQIKDSTSNARHGTSAGTMTTTDQVAGQVDGSLDFDGTNDRIDTANFMPSSITAWTAQAWVYKAATKDARIVYKNNAGNTGHPVFGLASGGTNLLRCRMRVADGTGVDASAGAISLNTWTFVACTYDGSNVRNYLNGVLQLTTAKTGTLAATADVVVIAQNEAGATVDRHWPGKIDEARVSNTARSTGWITTEYNNQSSPSTFYSVGAEDSF